MNRLKRAAILIMAAIAWASAGIAWADDAGECARLYEAGRYEQAFPVCKRAAEHGDAEAQFILGMMYEFGQSVKQDYPEAVKWYRKAAEQGDSVAQKNLGLIYLAGRGVKKNQVKAASWYRKAAEHGDVEAQVILGEILADGGGIEQDHAEAAHWFLLAAKHGDAEAQFNLGVMYSTGLGVKKDASIAADWYFKAGLSYLKNSKPRDAMICANRIKDLTSLFSRLFNPSDPIVLLAEKLEARITGGKARQGRNHL